MTIRAAIAVRKIVTGSLAFIAIPLLVAGCAAGGGVDGSKVAAGSSSVSAAPTVSNVSAAPSVEVVAGGTATVTVGQRIHFVGPSDVNMSAVLSNLAQATYDGDTMTVIGLKPGTQPVTFPNYNKHFDCPNGPCAHPNETIRMTLTVRSGGVAPAIAAPITLTANDGGKTLHLKVGQQLKAPAGWTFAVRDFGDPQAATVLNSDPPVVVAVAPGTARFDSHASNGSSRSISITVSVSR